MRSERPWGQTVWALTARLESRLASEGLGSCQCGVVRDAFWKAPLAAERGPHERLCPGAGLGVRILEVPTVSWSWDTYTDKLCPMLLVPLQRWEEGPGQYFS